MKNQSETPKVTNLENESNSEAASQRRIDRMAEEAAEKSSRTEQKFDSNHQIFSK
jgi:hypothetical protein